MSLAVLVSYGISLFSFLKLLKTQTSYFMSFEFVKKGGSTCVSNTEGIVFAGRLSPKEEPETHSCRDQDLFGKSKMHQKC